MNAQKNAQAAGMQSGMMNQNGMMQQGGMDPMMQQNGMMQQGGMDPMMQQNGFIPLRLGMLKEIRENDSTRSCN